MFTIEVQLGIYFVALGFTIFSMIIASAIASIGGIKFNISEQFPVEDLVILPIVTTVIIDIVAFGFILIFEGIK